MLLEFGRGSLLAKGRQQPEKVREVLLKARTDGLLPTLEAIRSKLDQPLALGYCNVGQILATGSDVKHFAEGDRVVSNGKHAEIVSVPQNLCAKIPDAVSDETAAFTILGAVALQGVRLAMPTLGECVAVLGLGIVGLLAVQILRANGCRVLAVDLNPARLQLARRFGAEVVDLSSGETAVGAANSFSRGRGMDAVLLTASTSSSEPVHQAAQMCRKRGRIVLVGVTGLELSRADFYEKELSFQVSCSYGPGRYDASYEELGHDYPVGYVRWTEQRNFEAVLDLMASGAIDTSALVTHRFDVADAAKAYDVLASGEPSLGILLRYSSAGADDPPKTRRTIELTTDREVRLASSRNESGDSTSVGFIGAGNYGSRVLMASFKAAGARLHTVVSAVGVSATHHGRRNGFLQASTDPAAVIDAPDIAVVVIATRHDTHANFVVSALKAGKHVFVEKPLALTIDELDAVRTAYDASLSGGSRHMLVVGFNRRFAPQIVKIKALLRGLTEPKNLVMTVNAGSIPADHWTQNAAIGGGRLVGEACHFIDLLRHLAGAPIVGFECDSLKTAGGPARPDNATIVLRFGDGSVGTVHYFANGHRSFPKERLEVFCAGRVVQLDNFRRLRGFGWPGFSRMNLWRQDKGQNACVAAFLKAVRNGGPAPIPADEVFEVSSVAIQVAAGA